VQVGFAREALFSQHEQAFISDKQVNARRKPATTWNKPLRDFACRRSGAEHADDDAFRRLDQRDAIRHSPASHGWRDSAGRV
jgi:hypothetical protein